MMHSKVSQRYARALFQLAREKGIQVEIYHDLKTLGEVIERSADFESFLRNPEIDMAKRVRVFEALLKGKVASLTYDFVFFLGQKNRLPELKSVCRIFEEMYLQDQGILKARVHSARTLDDG